MKFSLFTTRTSKPSLRLRILARCFQGVSVLVAAMTVGIAIYRQFFLDHTHTPRWAFGPHYWFVAVSTTSMFLVGRALLRRQRWGAFLAAATLGIPIIKQLIDPNSMNADIPQIALGTLALCTLVTVWDELGGSHDADFDDERAKDVADDPQLALSNEAHGNDDDVADAREIGSPSYATPLLLTTPAPTINKATAKSPLPISTARDI